MKPFMMCPCASNRSPYSPPAFHSRLSFSLIISQDLEGIRVAQLR